MALAELSNQSHAVEITHPPMASIETLPAEILIDIFDRLKRPDQLNAALVSKQVSHAVTGPLYRDVTIDITRDKLQSDKLAYARRCSLLSRTLSTQPQLADMVRESRIGIE